MSPERQEKKFFGRCELQDAGPNRKILYIPIDLFHNIKDAPGDRHRIDTFARLYMQAFERRSRPLWATEYEEYYAIEMPRDASNEQIQQLVSLIESEQLPGGSR